MAATSKSRVMSDDGDSDRDAAPPHALFLAPEMRREKHHFWAFRGSTST